MAKDESGIPPKGVVEDVIFPEAPEKWLLAERARMTFERLGMILTITSMLKVIELWTSPMVPLTVLFLEGYEVMDVPHRFPLRPLP